MDMKPVDSEIRMNDSATTERSQQENRLVNQAVEEVFHDWITRNLGFNYESLVAGLLRHTLVELVEDEDGFVVGFKKGRVLTEDERYRVADGVLKCIEYVLGKSD